MRFFPLFTNLLFDCFLQHWWEQCNEWTLYNDILNNWFSERTHAFELKKATECNYLLDVIIESTFFFGFSLKIQRHHLNMHFLILLLVNNLKTFTHIKCTSLWLCWRILHNFDELPLLILLYLLSIIIIQMTDDKQLQCLLQHWIQMTLFNKSNVKLH